MNNDINRLRELFMADFGVSRAAPEYHKTKSVVVNGNQWAFTLRPVKMADDLRWMAIHSDFIPSDSLSAAIANDMASELTNAAISVAAINGHPIFQFMAIKVTTEELVNIRDLLNPPARFRFAAAEEFLRWLKDSEDGQTLVQFIQSEYKKAYSDSSVILPKEDEIPDDHIFKCKACYYDWVVPHEKMERLEGQVSKGGLYCPSCGDITPESLPPAEDEKGPLGVPGNPS